jgi:hypothetical protein
MSRKVFRLVLILSATAALGACGTSTPADGGAQPDAGTQTDGGGTGCVPDGGCPATGCANISDTYRICASCPGLGSFGPFVTTVAHTCGCQFEGCVTVSDGGTQCGAGCIDTANNVTATFVFSGINVSCTGTYNTTNRSANFTCPLGPLGTCTAALRQGAAGGCPDGGI